MSEKSSLNNKFQDKLNIIKKFFIDIYSGERIYSSFTNKVINTFKVLIVSAKKFINDDCLTKSSSIAYTTIISLIPTLTVLLTFYSIFSGVEDKKEGLFQEITMFMLEHNIKLNIDPIIEAISSLIENAGKIGGIGAIIMIFSATALLRTFEKSLNDIWNIKKGRPMLLRLIYYWAALTLGPMLILSSTTLTSKITDVFSSPNFNSAFISEQDKIWVVGNKAKINYSSNNNFNYTSLTIDAIDFDNQRIFTFDSVGGVFKEHEFRIEELEYIKSVFNDIQFIDDNGWIIGDNGLILITRDKGRTWTLNKFGSFNLNDIHMIDSKTGFIASDNGYVLSTKDSGYNWNVKEWKKISSNLNSISFYNNNGIITGDSGIILRTNDGGATWNRKQIYEAKRKKRYVNLNCLHFVDEKHVFAAGDDGIILISKDAGKNWEKRRFLEKNYYSILFTDRSNGFITGEKGIVISTSDGGDKWHKKEITDNHINKILVNNGNLWIAGDMGLIMKSTDNGETWNGIEEKNIILYTLNFFAPFLFIWLFFLVAYLVLPNTKIEFKSASIGAAFTSAVWVTFILLFNYYVKFFAKGTLAIYGALAAIPIFLLIVYASSLIILYGAEVSYTLMHPHTYLEMKKDEIEKMNFHLFYGIVILYEIYKNFEDGNGVTTLDRIFKITSNKNEAEHFINLFKTKKWIIETEEGSLIPANSSKNILIFDLIEMIHDVSLTIPALISTSDPLRKYFEKIFNTMRSSKQEILKGISLSNVIDETG